MCSSDLLAADAARWTGVLQSVIAVLGEDLAATVIGVGSEAQPWEVPLAAGLALRAWLHGASVLHVALGWDRRIVDLGGSCPVVRVSLAAELARIDFAGPSLQALRTVSGTVRFSARGAVPLRMGVDRIAVRADAIALRLAWEDAAFGASVAAPGLAAEIDGWSAPLSLPTRGADGRLVACHLPDGA